jgi:hypothetical protein
LEIFNTFQGQIEGLFANMHQEIGKIQTEYNLKLQEVREVADANTSLLSTIAVSLDLSWFLYTVYTAELNKPSISVAVP